MELDFSYWLGVDAQLFWCLVPRLSLPVGLPTITELLPDPNKELGKAEGERWGTGIELTLGYCEKSFRIVIPLK